MMNIKKLIAPLLAVTLLAGCQTTTPMEQARDDDWSRFGAEGRDTGPHLALGALQGGESNVIVKATIVDVCAKKGCWMQVKDGDDELFVRFQDYGFFVPRNAAGHRVVMHGTSQLQVTSVDELRHYAEDAGKSPEEIAAITEPQQRVVFFADSVYIEGAGLEPPHEE
jgi:hypothetical protein